MEDTSFGFAASLEKTGTLKESRMDVDQINLVFIQMVFNISWLRLTPKLRCVLLVRHNGRHSHQ